MTLDNASRIVLDTNILVSAVLKPESGPARIIELVVQGVCRSYTSPAILEEMWEVARDEPDLRALITIFTAHSELTTPEPVRICRDPDDDKFLACALATNATLVTGDNDLLTLDGILPIDIVTPGTFLRCLEDA